MILQMPCYKSIPIPEDLSFDEASLFWRLRLGEGMPSHKWHKPSDRNKSWQEIKVSLDQKIGTVCREKGLEKEVSLATRLQEQVSNMTNRLGRILRAAFLFSD